MTQILQRVTTEYIDIEDRIRLSGEVAGGAPVVIWMTLRLLQRLLPIVVAWLERRETDNGTSSSRSRAEVMQEFSQAAAKAELAPQPPVCALPESEDWVALAVDVADQGLFINMTFRAGNGRQAALSLEAKPLRQWLAILHGAYLKAGWPLDMWPRWIREGVAAAESGAKTALLH